MVEAVLTDRNVIGCAHIFPHRFLMAVGKRHNWRISGTFCSGFSLSSASGRYKNVAGNRNKRGRCGDYLFD